MLENKNKYKIYKKLKVKITIQLRISFKIIINKQILVKRLIRIWIINNWVIIVYFQMGKYRNH